MTTTIMQREELICEAEQQNTAMTAAHREETTDSKDQKLLALIEKRKKMDRKEKAQVRDISKQEDQKKESERAKDPKDMRRKEHS